MIHALPGMGADRRMFPQPWDALHNFSAHNWPSPIQCDSIRELALLTCDTYSIRDGDSLVGTSLGGIVACEITKIRKIRNLYLVASASTKDAVNPILSILHPLASVAPIRWLQFSASAVDMDLMQMFADSDPKFIRAMCRAIFDWDGLCPQSIRIHRIHGKNDRIIPLPDLCDLAIDGGHLISMSHARECVEYISHEEY